MTSLGLIKLGTKQQLKKCQLRTSQMLTPLSILEENVENVWSQGNSNDVTKWNCRTPQNGNHAVPIKWKEESAGTFLKCLQSLQNDLCRWVVQKQKKNKKNKQKFCFNIPISFTDPQTHHSSLKTGIIRAHRATQTPKKTKQWRKVAQKKIKGGGICTINGRIERMSENWQRLKPDGWSHRNAQQAIQLLVHTKLAQSKDLWQHKHLQNIEF